MVDIEERMIPAHDGRSAHWRGMFTEEKALALARIEDEGILCSAGHTWRLSFHCFARDALR